MSQPPYLQKFTVDLKGNCQCIGCQRKLRKTIPKFQKHIADNYGLQVSKFCLESGIVEIIGEVDASKLEELKERLQKFAKKDSSNTTSEGFCGCFWRSKKKKNTNSEAQLNDHLKNTSINNNENNDNNKCEKDGDKDQPKASHHQQQQQQQNPDTNSKSKGKMGEVGKGSSQQGKAIKLGGPSENMNRRGESRQMGQHPRGLTMSESNQMGQVGQYARDEIVAAYDQNDQMGQYPRGQTKAHYGRMDHTNMHPMCQMGQMNGGYYQQPAHVPQISPFSDEPTADGCTIM